MLVPSNLIPNISILNGFPQQKEFYHDHLHTALKLCRAVNLSLETIQMAVVLLPLTLDLTQIEILY